MPALFMNQLWIKQANRDYQDYVTRQLKLFIIFQVLFEDDKKKLIMNHGNKLELFFLTLPKVALPITVCRAVGVIPVGEDEPLLFTQSSPVFFHYLH